MVCMFSQWAEAFPWRQAAACFAAKILLEKIIPTWGTPHLLDKYFKKSVLFGWFYKHFHCADYHPHPLI